MSKNIFQNTVQAAQQVTEAPTSGNSFAIPTTGVYPATLQLCYVKQNANKPSNTDLHFIFKLDNGFTWNYPVYSVLVNGQAHQTDKDGKPKTEVKDGVESYIFEDKEKFDEELNKFLEETEIEIDTWMIPFEAVDNLKLSVSELGRIDFILKEPEENESK